jgi:spore coat protein A
VIYINTGNLYKAPEAVNLCLASATPQTATNCFDTGVYGTSMMALNLADGSIVWATRLNADVWNSFCVPNQPCMGSPGYVTSDYDFSQGNILFSVNGQDYVGAAQKSGIVWKLDRDTGAIASYIQVGPGNSGGGMMFGSSADENNIYIANNNAGSGAFVVSDGTTCTAGIFAAIRKSDLSIAWSICNPSGGRASGATTVVPGGVVFVSSRDPRGWMYALDASNGAVLWSFQSGSTNSAGASITNGLVLWGTGYARYGLGTSGFTFYAFEVPSRNSASDAPSTGVPTLAPTEAPTPAPSYPPNTILASSNADGVPSWEPNTLTVEVGDSVTWAPLKFHTVVQTISATSMIPVTNGIATPAGASTFSHTFTTDDIDNNGGNVFYFICTIHPTMLVTITVNLAQGQTLAPTVAATPAPTIGGQGPQANCPIPGSPSSVYNSTKQGIRYFVDELPIPAIAKPQSTSGDADVYNIEISEFQVQVHSDLNPVTIRGYNSMLPGPTIEAYQGRTITVHWKNNLVNSELLTNMETVPKNMSTTGIVTHVHGHDSDAFSDGVPEQTVDVGQTFTGTYQNNMHPGTLWYHDHAMGITRANVYMGLAGLYLVRAPSEINLNLPTKEIPLLIQDKIVVVGDQGQTEFYYPDHWTMAWFGEVMLVNGKIWPKTTVDPSTYRLRIVNGANARFLDLSFSSGMSFTVIANDQGYLKKPQTVTSVLLAPAERVDIIVDFCTFGGQQIILQNSANAPYPGSSDQPQGIDPCLQGRIMLFNVNSGGECTSFSTGAFVNAETHPVVSAKPISGETPSRDLVLGMDSSGYMIPKLGIRDPNKGQPILYEYEDPATEIVKNGTLEVWRLINMTPDTHPVHLHVSAFMILGRQNFDVAQMKNGSLVLQGSMIPPEPFESGPKDTVRVDPGTVTSILIGFTQKNGKYMWHCHMLEHEENAMMRPLIVTYSLPGSTGLYSAATRIELGITLLIILFSLLF